ncbi:MAG: inorganic phosphate transporter, partial [Acutalibacteraceae bacterium]|nr:inorganic phosphate transporter [Acutalibacteraceae bacterium]
VVYSVGASYFGIPTSESHSLIAGITGSAIAVQGFNGINMGEWAKVLIGLVLSLCLGFFSGYLICKLVTVIFARADRRRTNGFFRGAQIFGAAAMSFMHGAQDGQKFIGVLFLGLTLVNGQSEMSGEIPIPIWLMILCSVIMAVGTSVGGEKIIKSVGMDMVKLEKYQGFAADLSAAFCLFLSSTFGIPVSTTHTKTTAIMGVGAVRRLSAINFGVVKEMILTWIFTFPGCGLISFLMAKLFMLIW